VQPFPSLHVVPFGFAGSEHAPLVGSQTPALWHWSDAAHTTGAVPVQTPPRQTSVRVQPLPSLQGASFGLFGYSHFPVDRWHTPASWHWSGGAQVTGVPAQAPAWQTSPEVQPFPSLQAVPESGAWTHPVSGLQLSAVHGLLSSHDTVGLEQLPPTHMPSTWHLSLAPQLMPSSFWQAPVALQALQAPQPLLLQQKPSVQNRLAAHCSGAVHGAPAGFLPQRFPTQVLGSTQSAFAVQVSLQAVLPLHLNGPHVRVPPPPSQLPLPLQVLASVTVDVPAGHDGGTHWVPAGYLRQPPFPSHLPSLPQVLAPVTPHLPLGSFWLAATGEQVPGDALNVHETQAPSQAALQQTFCAEQTSPALHSFGDAHGLPLGLSPHDPFTQRAPAAQSASALHADRQALVPQLNGKQDVGSGVAQRPAPSQVDRPVNIVVPDGHVGFLQLVPAA